MVSYEMRAEHLPYRAQSCFKLAQIRPRIIYVDVYVKMATLILSSVIEILVLIHFIIKLYDILVFSQAAVSCRHNGGMRKDCFLAILYPFAY